MLEGYAGFADDGLTFIILKYLTKICICRVPLVLNL